MDKRNNFESAIIQINGKDMDKSKKIQSAIIQNNRKDKDKHKNFGISDHSKQWKDNDKRKNLNQRSYKVTEKTRINAKKSAIIQNNGKDRDKRKKIAIF